MSDAVGTVDGMFIGVWFRSLQAGLRRLASREPDTCALEQHLSDLEDLDAADATYRDWEEDGFATISWAEAKAQLGL